MVWLLDYGLDDLGFDCKQGQQIFLFSQPSRPALGHTQLPVEWIQGVISPGVERSSLQSDHSPQSAVEVRNDWSYTSTPPFMFPRRRQRQLYL